MLPTKNHSNSRPSNQNRNKDHILKGDSRRPYTNSTHRQEKIKIKAEERTLTTLQNSFCAEFDSGNNQGMSPLFILVMLGLLAHTASASPTDQEKPHQKGAGLSEKQLGEACTNTNILPANKLEASIMGSEYDTALKKHVFFERFKTGLPNGKSLDQLQSEGAKRTAEFEKFNAREKAITNQYITSEKIRESCKVASLFKSEYEIDYTVLNQIINEKIFLHQSILEIYSNPGAPVLGNCFEMTAQAGLFLLPQLKSGEEFFLEIGAEDASSTIKHVYGMVVPKNLLMGEGIGAVSTKRKFVSRFTRPYFYKGEAVIKLTPQERASSTALFWEALGIQNSKISNKEVANQAMLCDPYTGKGLYCDGLELCFNDDQSRNTYLSALGKISYIKVFSWNLPDELVNKLDKFTELNCLNEQINQKIVSLVENKIKPALLKTNAGKPSKKAEL